jgi:copper chaperone CopZ
MRVRDAIKGVSGVKKVKVNLKKRTACIVSEVAITRQSLEKALLLVGYQLDEEAHP